MNFLDKLNPEQREAVLHRDGPLLILAGAGSGKTRVITYRIAYLIGDGHARAGRGARGHVHEQGRAGDARARRGAASATSAGGVWLSTFHSLCARLLRREAPKIGLSRDFVIYDSSDQVAVVKQAQRELGIDDKLVPPRMALSRISQAKNRMEGPDVAARHVEPARRADREDLREVPHRAEGQQRARLRRSAAEDGRAVRDVRADARTATRGKFRYVMVDEYQDTNRPQYLLIKRLAETHRNLAVVGDPDQSIYKWRGADLRNILDFEHDFPEARRSSSSSRTTARRR